VRSELHHSLQRKWSEILKRDFNCNFIVQEFENSLLGENFIFDIYAENPEGRKFIVEIGTISKRKLQKLHEFCQQNPEYTFFYDGYNKFERKELGLTRNIYEKTKKRKTRSEIIDDLRKRDDWWQIEEIEENPKTQSLTSQQALAIFTFLTILFIVYALFFL